MLTGAKAQTTNGRAVAEILRKAAELPWLQFDMARDANNGFAAWWEKNAVRWCAFGAICKSGGAPSCSMDAARAISALEVVIDGPIPQWNDTPGRTHEEVRAAMLKAAEQSEAADAA